MKKQEILSAIAALSTDRLGYELRRWESDIAGIL